MVLELLNSTLSGDMIYMSRMLLCLSDKLGSDNGGSVDGT